MILSHKPKKLPYNKVSYMIFRLVHNYAFQKECTNYIFDQNKSFGWHGFFIKKVLSSSFMVLPTGGFKSNQSSKTENIKIRNTLVLFLDISLKEDKNLQLAITR